MQELIKKLRDKLTEWWDKTEKKDRSRFFIITGVALAGIIIAVVLLSGTQYAVLYRDMDPAQAGEIMALLEEAGVKPRTEGAGTILVPAEQVDQLLMDMARQGYPKSGYTYGLLAKGSGFGTTDTEKRIYERLDLQERLGTTLRQFAPGIIKDARVEIAEQDAGSVLLVSQVMPTTASVMLTLEGNALSEDNVAAIENLVAASVKGLLPDNVFITNQYLQRLNHTERATLSGSDTDYEKAAAVRADFVQSIMSLLAPIFGVDNVRVSGQVDLDFDEHSTESVVFKPVVDDTGIDISLREITEKAKGTPTAAGAPGTETNGAAPIYPEVTGGMASDYSKITREINREVNETRENIKHAKGTIKDLSVSVAINSDNLSDENNSADAVKNLVANVVGLDQAEYNRISVEFRKFDGLTATSAAQEKFESARQTAAWMDLAKVLGLYALIIVCVFIIIRRFSKLFGKPRQGESEKMAMEVLTQAEEELNEYGELVKLATGPAGEEITISKSPSRERVEEFIDKNPDAVANLLRNWLTEETGKGRRR